MTFHYVKIPYKPLRITRDRTFRRAYTAIHPLYGHMIFIYHNPAVRGWQIREDATIQRIHPGPYAYCDHALRACYEYLPHYFLRWNNTDINHLTSIPGDYTISRRRPGTQHLNEGWTLYYRRQRMCAIKYQKYLPTLCNAAQYHHWLARETPLPVPRVFISLPTVLKESPFIHDYGVEACNAAVQWPPYTSTRMYDPHNPENNYVRLKNKDPIVPWISYKKMSEWGR